jgi:DNA-binding GntR family transcriptional regulator
VTANVASVTDNHSKSRSVIASRAENVRKTKPENAAAAAASNSEQAVPAVIRDLKLTQIAYEKIRRAIVFGSLDLGEPLSENDLAKALGVSKAPIRESLNQLRLEGLVEVVPQSGSYVFSPTSEQIRELCDFRSLLETRALRASMEKDKRALLAAMRKTVLEMKRAYRAADLFQSKRLDTEFHQAIIAHSGNRYLVQSYANIGHSVEALRHRFMDTAIYRNQAFDEHQKMIDLLASNSTARAIDVLLEHINRTKHFQARVSWPVGRLRRRDYKFRDYSEIFAEPHPEN